MESGSQGRLLSRLLKRVRSRTRDVPLDETVNGQETIGHSTQGRPLIVRYCAGRGTNLRVFILAGQHGDEDDARKAASTYSAEIESSPSKIVHAAILSDGNPDGAAAGTRRNASDLDLNRDHLLLESSETRAVHAFVNRWQPDLIIDVHTYRPWRPELLQHGFVFAQDAMVDVPTNPAIRLSWPASAETSLFDFLNSRMADAAFRYDRYTLVRPSGIVRHSTLDILDARNMLSLRHGIPTVLLEGRRSSPDDPPIFAPPHLVLLRAIQVFVEWAGLHATALQRSFAAISGSSELIPVRCHYADLNPAMRYMAMQSVTDGDIQMVGIPGSYLSSVRITRAVCAPRAYAVARNAVELLDLLDRHHFETAPPDRFREAVAEVCYTESPDRFTF